MSGKNTNENLKFSDVIGSIKFGRWDKPYILLYTLLIVVGVLLLLSGGIIYPLLYVYDTLTLSTFIAIFVTFTLIGLSCIIFPGICFMKIKKGKELLNRCLEDGDLHRIRANVIVTTASSYAGRSRIPAVITLRFKVNGKKYEKRKVNYISYAEQYYYIYILYSITHDEVFLLKMD